MKGRFRASKTYEIRVNVSITVTVLGDISFHVMAENLETSEGFICLFAFFVCIRIEIESVRRQ